MSTMITEEGINPVDCCVPNPNDVEAEEQLLARARALHPDQTFGPDAPSRFRKQ